MKINANINKKIIICFTGEPRSIIKGLKSRNKVFYQNNIPNSEIESRYIISFLDDQKKINNKSKILKRFGLFKYDKTLESLKLQPHKYNNMWLNLILQKHEILYDLKKDKKNLEEYIILLTRTDWLFTKDTFMLISRSIKYNKITVPFITNQYSEFKGKKYKPIFDQFMVIPGNLINEVIRSLETSLEIALKQNIKPNNKNLNLGSNGENRDGLTPENLLGLGFMLSKLDSKLEVLNNFSFSFPPDIYGTNQHNLIRDDAHIWMNLSFKDFIIKLSWFLKAKIHKNIFKKFIKFLE